jgi:hypothetical protein
MYWTKVLIWTLIGAAALSEATEKGSAGRCCVALTARAGC